MPTVWRRRCQDAGWRHQREIQVLVPLVPVQLAAGASTQARLERFGRAASPRPRRAQADHPCAVQVRAMRPSEEGPRVHGYWRPQCRPSAGSGAPSRTLPRPLTSIPTACLLAATPQVLSITKRACEAAPPHTVRSDDSGATTAAASLRGELGSQVDGASCLRLSPTCSNSVQVSCSNEV